MTDTENKTVKKLAQSIYNSVVLLQIEVSKGKKGNINLAIEKIEQQLNLLKTYYKL